MSTADEVVATIVAHEAVAQGASVADEAVAKGASTAHEAAARTLLAMDVATAARGTSAHRRVCPALSTALPNGVAGRRRLPAVAQPGARGPPRPPDIWLVLLPYPKNGECSLFQAPLDVVDHCAVDRELTGDFSARAYAVAS